MSDKGKLIGKNCCRFDGQVCEEIGACYEAECQPPMKCYPGDGDGGDVGCGKCEADQGSAPSPGGAFHWSPQDRSECIALFTSALSSGTSLSADTIRNYAVCLTNKFATDAVYTWKEISDSLHNTDKALPGMEGYMDIAAKACNIPENLSNSVLGARGGGAPSSIPKACAKDKDCKSGYKCSNGKCSKTSSHLVTYLLVGGGVILVLLIALMFMYMKRKPVQYY